MYSWILGISITAFTISFLSNLTNLAGENWITLIFTLSELIGYITLQFLYYFLKKSIAKVNLDMLNYVIDNKCTDGALKRALEVYTLKYDNDLENAFIATIAIALSVGLLMIIIVIQNKNIINRLAELRHIRFNEEEPGPNEL